MSDPYFSDVALLLHFDGANNSTTFTDSSASPKTVTPAGNAKISTTQSKFGGASGYFDGVGDHLTVNPAINEAGDFTVECWAWFESGGDANGALFTLSGGGLLIEVYRVGTHMQVYFSPGGDAIIGSDPVSYATAWYHVALCRQSGVFKLYLNGVLQGSYSSSTTVTPTTMIIGAYNTTGTEQHKGYIDDLRVTRGLARYTSNFTPPTAAFPNAGVLIIPTIGTITLIGQTPGVKTPYGATPAQGSLTQLGGSAHFSGFVFYGHPAQADIGIVGGTPTGLAVGFAAAPAQKQLAIAGQAPVFVNRLLYAIKSHAIRTLYRCYLTGGNDALPELELKISSFQTRYGSNPLKIYLSVVVNGIDSYIDAINARPNGLLRVDRIYEYLDGSSESFLMAIVAFDTLDIFSGGKSGMTGMLSGFQNISSLTPQSIGLSSPTYYSLSGGRRRYRCALDPRLRPGDTATINGDTFTVGSVVHIVDARTTTMEIAEA